MIDPADPISAITHPDPYPWYARLVAERPVYRDAERGIWVVCGAGAVTAALTNAACHVRPASEPVPAALLGSPAGDIFGRLVRMSDGDRHRPLKDAVAASLASADPARVASLSRDWAARLVEDREQTDIVDDLSVHVVGSLIGIPEDRLRQTARWMSAFVRCFSPLSTPAQIEQGKLAAEQLQLLFRALLADRPGVSNGGLLNSLADEADRAGCHDVELVVANGIGSLSQAHEATAGLIGNTLVTLARHRHLLDRLASDPTLLERVILEVLRYDPPVQNTRRFVAQDTTVAGQAMRAGDAILVVLAAANRDPSANPNPGSFNPDREDRRTFTFGGGAHACPGNSLAVTIAMAGVEALLTAGLLPVEPVRYRPSTNLRVPIIDWNRSQAR